MEPETPPDNGEQLTTFHVRRAREGDAPSLEWIVNRFAPVLLANARYRLGKGLSKIYELVINNDPCYAYLMRSNALTEQKLVMAHVYGHCDFFKNNAWFSKTSRKMMDVLANHGARIRRYMDRHGVSVVEDFIEIAQQLVSC